MKKELFLIACLLCASTFAQYDTLTIDDFGDANQPLVLTVPESTFPVSINQNMMNDYVAGGVRNMALTALNGTSGTRFIDVVYYGFLATTPTGATGYTTLTYDSDTSTNLNPSGLFQSQYSNFLIGSSYAISIKIGSSSTTTATLSVYSGSLSAVCEATINIPESTAVQQYLVYYSSFVGSCDFSNVGAFVVTFNQTESGRIKMSYIGLWGSYLSSTPTATGTIGSTLSATSSSSQTPSVTPSFTPTIHTPSPTATTSATVTPSRTLPPPKENCYNHIDETRITPGSCILLNSCPISNERGVYFEYDYLYVGATGALSYYLIPSDQTHQCSTLPTNCFNLCGGGGYNPLIGQSYLGDVQQRVFQLWAYYDDFSSTSRALLVNGTSRITSE